MICRTLYSATAKLQSQSYIRCFCTVTKGEIKGKKNQLFDKEKTRVREKIGRIEKIDVRYEEPLNEVILAMNRGISTPYDCARHISEGIMKMSALALVDGSPWDMHKPLESPCHLKLLTMKSPLINTTNQAFWRTCSFMLGAVIDDSMRDDIEVHLYSFTYPNIKSGSFIYDAKIELSDWKPTDAQLRVMSAQFAKLVEKELPMERLEVGEDLALEIFQHNPFKTKQIPDIARNNEGRVVLYRVGDHIDISKGPMISHTGLVGRCTVTAVHKISSESVENLYRFQGVALPKGILLNHFAYGILEERARKLNNTMWLPHRIAEDSQEHLTLAAEN